MGNSESIKDADQAVSSTFQFDHEQQTFKIIVSSGTTSPSVKSVCVDDQPISFTAENMHVRFSLRRKFLQIIPFESQYELTLEPYHNSSTLYKVTLTHQDGPHGTTSTRTFPVRKQATSNG